MGEAVGQPDQQSVPDGETEADARGAGPGHRLAHAVDGAAPAVGDRDVVPDVVQVGVRAVGGAGLQLVHGLVLLPVLDPLAPGLAEEDPAPDGIRVPGGAERHGRQERGGGAVDGGPAGRGGGPLHGVDLDRVGVAEREPFPLAVRARGHGGHPGAAALGAVGELLAVAEEAVRVALQPLPHVVDEGARGRAAALGGGSGGQVVVMAEPGADLPGHAVAAAQRAVALAEPVGAAQDAAGQPGQQGADPAHVRGQPGAVGERHGAAAADGGGRQVAVQARGAPLVDVVADRGEPGHARDPRGRHRRGGGALGDAGQRGRAGHARRPGDRRAGAPCFVDGLHGGGGVGCRRGRGGGVRCRRSKDGGVRCRRSKDGGVGLTGPGRDGLGGSGLGIIGQGLGPRGRRRRLLDLRVHFQRVRPDPVGGERGAVRAGGADQ